MIKRENISRFKKGRTPWNKGVDIFIECKVCNKSFKIQAWQLGKRKFCSKKCCYQGRECTQLFKKGHPDLVPKESRGHTKETKRKISLSGIGKHSDEKAWNWKGDDVGYFALHHWVNRKWDKPVECECCGKTDGRLHWANENHTYKRNREDWSTLCPSCHKKWDSLNKFKIKYLLLNLNTCG
ncbi:MAG: hypothetical protein KKH44_10575 [Bacteroidetes bacterium]|nr:hypothetical protein [Bacteroidota bacterium]